MISPHGNAFFQFFKENVSIPFISSTFCNSNPCFMSYFSDSQPYPDVFLSVFDHIYGTPIVCASRFQSTTWTKWLSSFGICWYVVVSISYCLYSQCVSSWLYPAIVTRWCWNFIIISFPLQINAVITKKDSKRNRRDITTMKILDILDESVKSFSNVSTLETIHSFPKNMTHRIKLDIKNAQEIILTKIYQGGLLSQKLTYQNFWEKKNSQFPWW